MKSLIASIVTVGLLGGYIYIQSVELEQKRTEVKNCKANLKVAKSEIEAKSFELKWSDAFNYTLQQKGESNEKNGTFSDSF